MADNIQTISAEKLCALSGLTDRRHRQLAEEGYFPHPIESQYQLVATISGLFKYYRERNARTKDNAGDSRKRKTEVETKILEIKLAKEERRTIDKSEVNKLLLHIASKQKAVLSSSLEREYPGKCVGRNASEISLLGRQLCDRLCEIFNREVDQWTAQD